MNVVIHKPRTKYKVNQYVERGIQYRGPNRFRAVIRERGENLQETFTTLEAARQWRAVTRGAVLGEIYVDKSLAEKTALADACAWALNRLGTPPYRKANDKNLASKWRWWQSSKFAKWPLIKVDSRTLKRWSRDVLAADVGDDDADRAEAERELGEKIPSSQTVIHRLNALSRLVKDWRDYHRLDEEALPNPVTEGVRPPLTYAKRRRLKQGEQERLLDPRHTNRPWLKHAIILSIETCARQTELARLTWENVFLEADDPHMILVNTKNGRDRTVPLSEAAIDAMLELRELAETHNKGLRADQVSRWEKPLPVDTGRGIIHAWADMLELVNTTYGATPIEDLTWHCLRHEGISRLFERTTMTDSEIMAISGHLGREQLARYTHLRAQTLQKKLPTLNDTAVAEGAGSVRLRHGAPPQLKNEKGRWVPLTDGDRISKVVALELLKGALRTLEDDLMQSSQAA